MATAPNSDHDIEVLADTCGQACLLRGRRDRLGHSALLVGVDLHHFFRKAELSLRRLGGN